MNSEEIYISQVLSKLPPGPMRAQIAMELRSHIADRVERGHTVAEAIAQLGDPAALAESYLSAVPLVPAPHLRRAAAKFVDLFFPYAFALGMAATYVFGLAPRVIIWEQPVAILAAATLLVGLGMYLVYIMFAESRAGQTLGKRMFGLRVVTESGTRIGLGQAFLRQLPVFLQIFMIDALFALFTDRRQRAFELLSKTRVVVDQESARAERVPAGGLHPVTL